MEPDDAGGLSPAEAFALLGHEHRVDILHALLSASREDAEYPASFATLFERTEIGVSSQFSYHLDALTGQFVRRTDEGYELRYAGWEVATSILAGTYTRRAAFEPTAVDGECPLCGGAALEAAYDEEWLTVGCGACDSRHARYPLPPGALHSRSLDGVLAMFDRYVRSHASLATDGVCSGCTGVMDVRTDPDGGLRGGRVAVCACRRCGNRLYPPLGLFVRDHDTVSGFLSGRTVTASDDRPAERPFWELEWCVADDCVDVVGTDPWRCRLEITHGTETLVVLLDDELTVESARVE